MEKRALVISCSDHYGHRMVYWERALRALGYRTSYVTSDFLHVEKKIYTCPVKDCIQIHVIPYRKNFSVQRILSHRMFAKKTLRCLEEERPQVVVSLLPPNFLTKYLAVYKRRHPETVLMFDIFDLWPETFPSSRLKRLLAPVFRVWGNLRDKHLPTADFVTAECDMFRRRLGLKEDRSAPLYFSLPPYRGAEVSPSLPRDCAKIAYLGSINNVVDIPRMASFLGELNHRMPTSLHIIGAGERCDEFRAAAAAEGVDVVFHGCIFDENEKHRILSQCHFGLNIMKDSVCVGLTMKSVDYFRHGLPIVNNIPADTEELVSLRRVGVNLSDASACADEVASLIREGVAPLKTSASALFDENFSDVQTETRCCEILKKVLSED